MEKTKVGRNHDVHSATSDYNNDDDIKRPSYNGPYDFFDDEWDDEDLVEEYFSKKKSRVRKQNRNVYKDNRYNEEW